MLARERRAPSGAALGRAGDRQDEARELTQRTARTRRASRLLGLVLEELAVPYEPWIEVCSQIVEHAPQELLARHCERHGGELGRLARKLGERVPELPSPQTSDPETERYLLFSAVAGLLEQVAAERAGVRGARRFALGRRAVGCAPQARGAHRSSRRRCR